tara:strand:- start:159 stop:947 length:789 start_codon:yes stop_codon:yes gene_type:complete
MATLLDERLDDEEQPEKTEQAESFDNEPVEQETHSEIPDKYRGKSAEDLVRMHQEAEKLLGRQSSEVGELRQVVDSYIQTQLSNQQAPSQQSETVDDVDFFSDPEEAVKRAIDNHPKIKEAENISKQYQKTTALSQLQQDHPDMQNILTDAKFAEWIKGSKIRTQLYVQADKQYDYEAAHELFTLWKERKQVVQQTATAEKQGRKQAVKNASTGSASGSSETKTRKIYRRADIIKLMRTDPERYQSLSDEIMKAYQEGRVRN